MRLDAYTHYIPPDFLERMNKVAGDHKDIGKRMRGIPAIYDLDVRKKVDRPIQGQGLRADHFLRDAADRAIRQGRRKLEYLKLINDGFAEICEANSSNYPGWIAQVSLAIPGRRVKEAERAMKNGALGIQIYTNVNDAPIDRPSTAVLDAHEQN